VRRAIFAGIFVGAAFMLEVSGSSYVADQAQGAAGPVDVCALLPREEVAKILGRNVRSRPGKRADGPTECRYSGGMQGTVTAMVGPGVTKAKWDDAMKILKQSGASLDPVPGVGDGAYFWNDNRLYVHTGNYEVTISTSPSPGDVGTKLRGDAVALAKAVVAKLKG
jgi:hypothetical protein